MNTVFPRINSLRATVLTVAAAVVTATAGLFAITIDHSAGWTPHPPEPVPAVQVNPWTAGGQDPASARPFLDGTDPAATRGTVSGTGSATVTGTPAMTAGAGLNVKTASFTGRAPLAAPVQGNDKGSGDFTGLPGASSGTWGGQRPDRRLQLELPVQRPEGTGRPDTVAGVGL